LPDIQKINFAGGNLTGARTGSGSDLLVIHSLLADRAAFDPVLPWLAQRFRVTLVNLPGFHGSEPIPPGIGNYADRIAAVFDGDAAAGFPPEGRKAFEVMADKVAKEGIASVATIAANRVFHEAYLAVHPGAVEERRKVLLGVAPDAFIAACRTLMETDLVPQLPTIRNPTLVVCGELDGATPPPLCRQMAAHIPGARYVELAGCGHCPPLEQPDAFIAAIADFLLSPVR
jgi:pimeloyl-ACP methyl ester carboxylesterase